ncbi:hypothetical protein RintRC_7642 [Richelia intracellularis]|nr:hypothetical protein RintRC_7642 [Richelia intracellularis]
MGVAESGDDFTQFSTIYQWFQRLIHPALMQRRIFIKSSKTWKILSKVKISIKN